ncbi:hypothetical protein G6L37_01030 [Agrobacterium rubi]|nr:hypothetical protein [Agrobacterium rubi]NTF23975.1 hypothetical protein [Agrobacterium rubi]
MTEKLNSIRGYDDSPYLKEMADGVIIRKYASVEDAAKSVLGEDSGSNVDRLRRKFREQQWYERGLNDYVDAEINRRGVDAAAPSHDPWFVDSKGVPMSEREIRVVKILLAMFRQITPTASMAFGGMGAAFTACVLHMRSVEPGVVLAPMVGLSVLGVAIWSFKAGLTSGVRKAAVQVGALVAFFGVLIYAMNRMVPDANFNTGSLPGSGLMAIGVTVIYLYLMAFANQRFRKAGRANSPEYIALAVAMTATSFFAGVGSFANDMKSISQRVEAVSHAYASLGSAISDMKKADPKADTGPINSVARELLLKSLASPDWKRDTSASAEN